ncbi:MAG: DHHA1 domain-containing protein [Leptolyngbya sp. BL-A-14]
MGSGESEARSQESEGNVVDSTGEARGKDVRRSQEPELTHAFILHPSSFILHPSPSPLARGSARSVNHIDLYQLVKDQAHLLHRFGGHPYAAGLSLPVENIPLFTEALNQQARQMAELNRPAIQADLTVTVADLGKDLFQTLKLLEPCGMGNPTPKLFLQNCWFRNVSNQNIKDWKGGKVRYIKTEFELWDESAQKGFPGLWWEHYQDDVPKGRCDAIVELDFNTYKKRYEVRLIAVRPCEATEATARRVEGEWIFDWRGLNKTEMEIGEPPRRGDAEDVSASYLTPNPQPPTPSSSASVLPVGLICRSGFVVLCRNNDRWRSLTPPHPRQLHMRSGKHWWELRNT